MHGIISEKKNTVGILKQILEILEEALLTFLPWERSDEIPERDQDAKKNTEDVSKDIYGKICVKFLEFFFFLKKYTKTYLKQCKAYYCNHQMRNY